MRSDGRRWLVVTSSFPRDDRDLAGHFVREWARALVEQGDWVDVLCWRGPGARDRRVVEGLMVRFVPYGPPDLETLFFGAGAPENLDRAPVRALMALPAVGAMTGAAVRTCRDRDYDGIVGHWLVPGGLVARTVGAAVGLGSAVVGHSGGVHLLAGLPEVVGRPLVRRIAGGPTTVTTRPLRAKLVETAGCDLEELQVAPMGYRPGPQSVERAPGDQGPMKVGFLGRLVDIKGLPAVLEAVERLRGRGRNVALEVVGDGPRREQWEAAAGEGVEFLGPKYGEDKWERLAGWDGLVVPSKRREDRHEGLPVSLLEGASVGAVPLVSGVPGVEPWLAGPERQVVGRRPADWVEAIEWLAGLSERSRSELRGRTRRNVAGLAWPEYGGWWRRWLVRGDV